MKKHYFIFAFLILTSCGVKQTQNLLSSGNYDLAIDNAISNLRTNKDKKGKQDYVYLLEEAFAKAKERDLNAINLLAKDTNPAQLEKISRERVRDELVRILTDQDLEMAAHNDAVLARFNEEARN